MLSFFRPQAGPRTIKDNTGEGESIQPFPVGGIIIVEMLSVKRLLVGLGTCLALLGWAGPVLAAGETVHVHSNELEVRFPTQVVLRLDVEAEADIAEIRLYHRAAPSGYWRYTYVDVGPSGRVVAETTLDTHGAAYLPPGVELEYYYSITDSEGNETVTDRKSVVYLDTGYDWKTSMAGPLEIYWHDLSGSKVDRVSKDVEEALRRVSDLLGIEPDGPMRGVIYNSRSEAARAFPFQSQATSDGVFGGYAFPSMGVFTGLGLDPRLLVHETAHLLLDQAVSQPGVRISAWLNEGFASYTEPGSKNFRRVESDPFRIPLRHMGTLPGRVADIGYFYSKSESVVGFLVETYGEERFRDFLDRLNRYKTQEPALREVYGFGVDGLEKQWAASFGAIQVQPSIDDVDEAKPPQPSLREEGNTDPGASIEDTDDTGARPAAPQEQEDPNRGASFNLGGLSTIIIAVLVLGLAGVMGARYVMRKLGAGRDDGDELDRLTDEEWRERP